MCIRDSNRTVAVLHKSGEHVIDGLNVLRMNEKFSSVFKKYNGKISELSLEELKFWGKRKHQKELVEQLTYMYIVSHVENTIDKSSLKS